MTRASSLHASTREVHTDEERVVSPVLSIVSPHSSCVPMPIAELEIVAERETSVSANDAAELCRACGLCCDGTMFSHASFSEDEHVGTETRRHLRMLTDRKFAQLCSAHSWNGCVVYDRRPTSCRSFRCALLVAYTEEGGPLEPRLQKVMRARFLADRIRAGLNAEDREGWLFDGVAALLDRPPADVPAELRLDVAELSIRLQRDFGKVANSVSVRAEEPALA